MNPQKIKTPHLYLTALAIGLAIGLIYTLFLSGDKAEGHTVTITKDGFIPSSLSIKQGEAVTFVSDGSVEEFWPASDSHPSHGIYPELDPRQPINANKSWTFVFDKTGLWKMHDHMNSLSKGRITVTNDYGDLIDECNEADSNNFYFKAGCIKSWFGKISATKGMDEVFDTFNLYLESEPNFRNRCHDVMHEIGRVAYDEYLQTGTVPVNESATLCSYGFFHGLIEAMYEDVGNYEKSRDFCQEIEQSKNIDNEILLKDSAAACRHGIGHAIFDSRIDAQWGDGDAMLVNDNKLCESIFDSLVHRQSCVSGVVNALDLAFTNEEYGVSYNHKDPFSHCRKLSEVYMQLCLNMETVFYPITQGLTREEAMDLFKTVDEKYFPKILVTWVGNKIQRHVTTDEEIIQEADLCFDYTDQNIIDHCLMGLHFGIYKKIGMAGYKTESERICHLFDTEDKIFQCLGQIKDNIYDEATSS